MEYKRNGRRNGFIYTNKTIKEHIQNNEFVGNIRKKLMENKLKKRIAK